MITTFMLRPTAGAARLEPAAMPVCRWLQACTARALRVRVHPDRIHQPAKRSEAAPVHPWRRSRSAAEQQPGVQP
eukprot:SAG31_NODE_638_length_13329_cov_13.538095_2_plen_75_part_00